VLRQTADATSHQYRHRKCQRPSQYNLYTDYCHLDNNPQKQRDGTAGDHGAGRSMTEVAAACCFETALSALKVTAWDAGYRPGLARARNSGIRLDFELKINILIPKVELVFVCLD
jgi:hypothetical protein